MSEEQEALIKPEDLGGDVQKYSDDDFNEVAASGKYLPRLQLLTSSSKKCKSGEFPINHFALVKDSNYDDLGAEVDVLIVAWRPKAIQITDETVIACFKPKTDEFQKIVEQSDVKDSGCLYGPEFLMYIPVRKSFALFFMGSKSARRESPNVKALMHNAGTLQAKFIQTPKYEWYAPEIKKCSTPFDMPDTEDMRAEVEKFNNPPESEVEVAAEGDETSDRAR